MVAWIRSMGFRRGNFVLRIREKSARNEMDWGEVAAWWAYQSVLELLRGLSHRWALLQQPFPLAICLCPVYSPFLAHFSSLFIPSSASSSIAHFGLSFLFDLFLLLLYCFSTLASLKLFPYRKR